MTLKLKTFILGSSCLLGLSACADLGFGDLELADLTPSFTSRNAASPQVAAGEEFGPANAKPGECYAKVTTPDEFRRELRQVVVTPATVRTETIPATYKTVQVEEIVKPASVRTEEIPATYKREIQQVQVSEAKTQTQTIPASFSTVSEQVVVTPARTKTVEVPAVYETVSERVKVRDAYTTWKPGGRIYAVGESALGGTILSNQQSSNGVMCLVEIPAEYKTVTKRVLVSPATTRTETIPAVTKTVERRVVASPEQIKTIPVPAEFKTVEVRVIDQPASVRNIPVPAVTKTVTKRVIDQPERVVEIPVPATFKNEEARVLVSEGSTVWTQVLCDVNATPDVVRTLQRALETRGFYNGPIDGVIGPLTRTAINGYQNGQSDVLSLDSARELGLAI